MCHFKTILTQVDGGILTKTITVTTVANNINIQSNVMGDRNVDSQLNPLDLQDWTFNTSLSTLAQPA